MATSRADGEKGADGNSGSSSWTYTCVVFYEYLVKSSQASHRQCGGEAEVFLHLRWKAVSRDDTPSRASLRWRTLHCCAVHHHNQSHTCCFHKLFALAENVGKKNLIIDNRKIFDFTFFKQISHKYIQWKWLNRPIFPSTLQSIYDRTGSPVPLLSVRWQCFTARWPCHTPTLAESWSPGSAARTSAAR